MAQRRELLGYAVPFVAMPGDTVQIMVTTEAETFDAEIVRLVHGDNDPAGPGFKAERIDSPANGSYPGRHQDTYVGSYAQVDASDALDPLEGFSVQAWIWPTTPDLDGTQGIITRLADGRGFGLSVESGALVLRVGDQALATDQALQPKRWHFVAGTFDAASGEASVQWRLLDVQERVTRTVSTVEGAINASNLPLLVGASGVLDVDRPAAIGCFNGKIESPRLFTRRLTDDELDALAGDGDPTELRGLAGCWNFAASPPTSATVVDAGPNGLDGVIHNYPMRGLTGHRWDATAFRRDDAPEQYGAIHFHADDFDDSRWEPDFEFEVPVGLRSGYYAAHLEGAGEHDYVPFFVSPPPGTTTAAIAFLAPTATYLAYANERLLTSSGDADFSGLTNIPIVLDPLDEFLGEHREYGGSIYDVHTDGSGVSYSSSRRPSCRCGRRTVTG